MSGEAPEAAPNEAAPREAPKAVPETLEIRARPRRVVRFRRGLIVGLAAGVSAAVVGVTWFALAPAGLRLAAHASEEGEPLRKGQPEALANAPATYGDVPRLGPPLPGDLGRPILDHARQSGAALPGAATPGMVAAPFEARPPGPLGPDKAAEEREAARRSPVGVQLTGRIAAPSGPSAATAGPAGATAFETGGEGPGPAAAAAQPGQQRKLEFAQSGGGTLDAHRLEGPVSPWTLSPGTVIPASLVTGLNSDLPGTVIGQVTEDVLDSATGRVVLVPRGSRLVGRYDSVVAFGQRRALVIWQRIVLPDGSSVGLDKLPATDASGYAGVADEVDFHTWRLLKGVGLSTLLGVGTQLGLGGGGSDLVRAIRESAQQSGTRAGEQLTQRNLDVQPTITVRPGYRLLVMVNKDLVLRPWKGRVRG